MEQLPTTIEYPEYNKGLDDYIEPLSEAVTLLRGPMESPDAWFQDTATTIIKLEETYKETTYWGLYDPQALYVRACTRLLQEAPGAHYNAVARHYLDGILKDVFELPSGQRMSRQLYAAVEMEVGRRAATNPAPKGQFATLEEAMKAKRETLENLSNMKRYLSRIKKKSIKDDHSPRSPSWTFASANDNYEPNAEKRIISCDDTAENKREALMRLAIGVPKVYLTTYFSLTEQAFGKEIARLQSTFTTETIPK